jgi:hypothetical protein
VALVAGVALRAALRAVAALVLVAGPADGEAALGARHEGLPVLPRPDLVPAHAARPHVRAPGRLGTVGLLVAGAHDVQLAPHVRARREAAGDRPAGVHGEQRQRQEGSEVSVKGRGSAWQGDIAGAREVGVVTGEEAGG